nr:MAG TPA: large terminase [Caudoviricetes sp.]
MVTKMAANPEVQNTQTKYEKIQAGLQKWTAFYRANPHRFGIDYLGMTWMATFQQILINVFFMFNYTMVIASRGMGKSQIVAAALCIYCILYPGTQVVIAAGVRSQSLNVLNKIIDEFYPKSQNLQNEIASFKIVPSEAYIKFKNGSIIKVVTAKDSSRSARAHLVIVDEFVQVKETIINTVLRKFKAGQRRPDFFDKPKYTDKPNVPKPDNWVHVPKEPNREVYISSAYYKYHYSWAKFNAFYKSMIKGESYFVCGFPYQLPVSAGYYPLSQIREEMQEENFDAVSWSMEMCSEFFGESTSAFFSFKDVSTQRKLILPVYPKPYYAILGDPKIKYQKKRLGEIRLLGIDVATQGGSKNDATAISLLQMIPTNYGYSRSATYMETLDGGHGQDQAIRIRQLFDDLDCDFIVIDSNGSGLSVFDELSQDQYDNERKTLYEAWSCINDEAMAARCRNPDAPKIMYSVKATAQFNSDAAVYLRDCMRRGKIRFLTDEADGKEWLNGSKYYQNLAVEDQVLFEAPFYQISAFVNEIVNLDYTLLNDKIKVKERSGARKDRYSSILYANFIAGEIEREHRNMEQEYGDNAPVFASVVNF